MSAAPSSTTETERPLPRIGLALVTALHALVFAWMAVVLPWRAAYAFSLPLGALAALHVALGVTALLRKRSVLLKLWAVVAYSSCAGLVLLAWSLLSTSLYLTNLYGGVGQAVAAGLLGVWCVVALFTLPISLWGLALGARLPIRPSRRWLRWGGGGVAVVFVASILLASQSAHAESIAHASDPELAPRLRDLIRRRLSPASGARLAALTEPNAKASRGEPKTRSKRKGASRSKKASSFRAAQCPQAVSAERLTLLVSWSGSKHKCLQAENADSLLRAVDDYLTHAKSLPRSVRLDLVSAVHELSSTLPLLDAVKLRPGLDGVCSEKRCLAPWELVALGAFTSYRPLAAVADAGFGVDFEVLRKQLDDDSESTALTRIETRSFFADDSRFIELSAETAPSGVAAPELERAARLAAAYIARAQADDGRFRYTLDPHTGIADDDSVNVARHAGTTLALCELGSGQAADDAAAKAVAFLATTEKKSGQLSVFTTDKKVGSLGHTALSLAALLTCRPRVGAAYDDAILRAGRALLKMQRDDGSFAPALELARGGPTGKRQSIYAAGQGVLALVLLEARSKPEQRERFRDATERAMQYYAGPYWQHGMKNFFFLEENWHCLAARAALTVHRNDAYERFCLDYVTFKSRFIQEPGKVPAAFVGGYGFSPLFPPHATPTAGFGEALAASLAVRRARGQDASHELALLEQVLAFLVRQQWQEDDCFACANPATSIGGFSESATSPIQRIDYTQHAWAALGHGARELAVAGKGN
jgi:hypothetical protein